MQTKQNKMPTHPKAFFKSIVSVKVQNLLETYTVACTILPLAHSYHSEIRSQQNIQQCPLLLPNFQLNQSTLKSTAYPYAAVSLEHLMQPRETQGQWDSKAGSCVATAAHSTCRQCVCDTQTMLEACMYTYVHIQVTNLSAGRGR